MSFKFAAGIGEFSLDLLDFLLCPWQANEFPIKRHKRIKKKDQRNQERDQISKLIEVITRNLSSDTMITQPTIPARLQTIPTITWAAVTDPRKGLGPVESPEE
ncbi:hypothetical protein SADUNF_Sadunf16G0073800 [Salix dunnii]|uniref:Uncharacterized protein n=1 Tax=Salix dunnii TaxID=1413687 RepID=A0A835ML47_9ROSI|nr:hypothetical protein SADUNF_Sadunf16G0073800 [Salix dunnii]